MINERAQYTAKTGLVTINTANSNLNGSGTLGTVLTASANGTFIKTIIIKANAETDQGIVRLFIDDGAGNINLISEYLINPTKRSGTYRSVSISTLLNFNLKAGQILKASTHYSNTYTILAEGLDWSY
jgi:hypothetical protein